MGTLDKKLLAILGITIIVIIAAVLIFTSGLFTTPPTGNQVTPTAPSSTSGDCSTGITIYAGEINTTTYGYGYSANSLTSPGPALDLQVGQRYTITLVNVGSMGHNLAIVDAKSPTANVIGGAIGSADSPIAPGASETMNIGPFTSPTTAYYICQVDDHVNLGMWGTINVTP